MVVVRVPVRVLALLLVLVLPAVAGCGGSGPDGAAESPRLSGAGGAGGTPAGSGPPPSVVLVTLDTTRADRLGAYGSSAGLTPRLDALAGGSAVFDLAIAQAAVTPVSHASILTGLQPYHHGLRVLHGNRRNRLHGDFVTLAEMLAADGYATGAFVSAFPAGSRFGLAQGFDTFDEDFLQDPGPSTVSPEGTVNTGRAQRRADATTDRAVAWLEGVSEPYFLWVHYFDPHDPTVLPPEGFRGGPPARTGSEEEWLRRVYDHEVAFMDAQVGRLLDAVDGPRRRRETAVVVTADHGEGLGDHDWWTHGILYQEQIHVPLILRLPGRDEGRRIEPLVRSIDLAPTLLDLAGVPESRRPTMDGRSLLPLLEDGANPGPDPKPVPHRNAYADSINLLTYGFTPNIRDVKDEILFTLIDPPWKYIHHLREPSESELYHLELDPAERVNVLQDNPDRVRTFLSDLRRRNVMPKDRGESPMDPEERDRLESLGYIQSDDR